MFVRGIILLAIIFSIGVCFVQPKMHTPVLIYNSDYEIVETTPIVKDVNPITTKETKVIQKTISQPVKQPEQKVIKSKQVQNSQTTEKKQPLKSIETTKKTVSYPKTKVSQTEKKIEKAPAKQEVKKQTETLTQKEREEIIAWNIWHSNLQNSIMRDTRMPHVQNGTMFYFTFNVDKYGRVSDVKTWSGTPDYNVFAMQYIAPVIKGYQGKPILNFPQDSQRITTKFEGHFRVNNAGQNKYSSASDFNDMEKIRK